MNQPNLESLKNLDKKKKLILILGIVAVLLLAIPLSVRSKQKNLIRTIYTAYKENPLKAKEKYDEKKVTFIARVDNIESSGAYIYVVPVNSMDGMTDSVRCYIKDEKSKNKITKIKKGDSVKITGTFHLGDLGGLIIDMEVDVQSIS